MDQGTLVGNKIHEGEMLVEQLARNGFDVTAAFWVLRSEEGGWLLYIASKVVDEKGPAAAYGIVYDALDGLPEPWVSMFEVKVIGANNPITKDVLEVHRRLTRKAPTHYRRPRLGNLSIEEAYVYPPLASTAPAGDGALIEKGTSKPAVEQVPSRRRFERLAGEWKEKAKHLSDVAQMAMLPAYQRIIGMGWEAVPYLLEELQREPNQWFWALEAIAEENPVPREANGKVLLMAQAWIEWGRKHNLIGQ